MVRLAIKLDPLLVPKDQCSDCDTNADCIISTRKGYMCQCQPGFTSVQAYVVCIEPIVDAKEFNSHHQLWPYLITDQL